MGVIDHQARDSAHLQDKKQRREELSFTCPSCQVRCGLDLVPRSGYIVMCGICLAILVAESGRCPETPHPIFRRILERDLALVNSGPYRVLVETKQRRVRARILARWIMQEERPIESS
jgi:hypothetical protein